MAEWDDDPNAGFAAFCGGPTRPPPPDADAGYAHYDYAAFNTQPAKQEPTTQHVQGAPGRPPPPNAHSKNDGDDWYVEEGADAEGNLTKPRSTAVLLQIWTRLFLYILIIILAIVVMVSLRITMNSLGNDACPFGYDLSSKAKTNKGKESQCHLTYFFFISALIAAVIFGGAGAFYLYHRRIRKSRVVAPCLCFMPLGNKAVFSYRSCTLMSDDSWQRAYIIVSVWYCLARRLHVDV
eukprot:m.1188757 g.1188757  ORF g.1188757 m.1188757 type:complete len:237 (-) comp24554_c0_seq24:1007-1717(-)